MNTAKEFLEIARLYRLPEQFGTKMPTDKCDFETALKMMKDYAHQVATQALKDAAENAKMRVDSIFGHEVMNVNSFCDQDGDTISIDKDSITNTKIEIP